MKVFNLLFAVFSLLALGHPALGQSTNRTWITNVTIISPENLNHIEQGNVLIEDGRIVRVERKSSSRKNPRKEPGSTIVSGKGQFLVPGLIDSHVHLADVPGMGFDQPANQPKLAEKYFQQLPRSYLYYGYTTVIDLAVVDRKVMEDFRQSPLH